MTHRALGMICLLPPLEKGHLEPHTESKFLQRHPRRGADEAPKKLAPTFDEYLTLNDKAPNRALVGGFQV